MSGRTKDAIVDFAAFSLVLIAFVAFRRDRFSGAKLLRVVRNPKFGFGALAATGRLSVSTFEPFNS
jgi:hypothetical protein